LLLEGAIDADWLVLASIKQEGLNMLALLDQGQGPFVANEAEATIAKAAADKLRTVAKSGHDIKIHVQGEANVIVPLPARAVDLIFRILETMGEGVPISVIPHHAELTTQQAADYLNVSRPFLVQQIDAHKLAYRKVGSHRRIKFSDLVEFENNSKVKQSAAMTRINEQAHKLGLD
jgi:excisionase family DNA binding protein